MPVAYILRGGIADRGLFVYFTLVAVPSCDCTNLHPTSGWWVVVSPAVPETIG